jgi:hypothetical protein
LATLLLLVYAPIAPLPCWLGWSLTLEHAREFVHATKALAFFASIPSSLKTIYALQALHISNLDSPCLDSLMDFQLNIDVELPMHSFKSTFLGMSHLLTCSLLSMVFEHFQNCLDLEDLVTNFIQHHQLSSHVAISHIS